MSIDDTAIEPGGFSQNSTGKVRFMNDPHENYSAANPPDYFVKVRAFPGPKRPGTSVRLRDLPFLLSLPSGESVYETLRSKRQ